MKSSDRTILLILPVVAALIAFWVLVIAPKQSEVGNLQSEITELQSSLSAAQAQISEGESARSSFNRSYADVVALGAAAPADSDQATFVYDMSKLGQENNVSFRSFEVAQSSDAAAAPATDATATEATAATLPLGATVGSAGLPIMPYNFSFFGNFFNVADLFGALDDQVTVSENKTQPEVKGRLTTIDGFALTENPSKGFPAVQANFSVTTYLVPADQGISAGADPAGPGVLAPAPDTTVTSIPAPPTASVTP